MLASYYTTWQRTIGDLREKYARAQLDTVDLQELGNKLDADRGSYQSCPADVGNAVRKLLESNCRRALDKQSAEQYALFAQSTLSVLLKRLQELGASSKFIIYSHFCKNLGNTAVHSATDAALDINDIIVLVPAILQHCALLLENMTRAAPSVATFTAVPAVISPVSGPWPRNRSPPRKQSPETTSSAAEPSAESSAPTAKLWIGNVPKGMDGAQLRVLAGCPCFCRVKESNWEDMTAFGGTPYNYAFANFKSVDDAVAAKEHLENLKDYDFVVKYNYKP